MAWEQLAKRKCSLIQSKREVSRLVEESTDDFSPFAAIHGYLDEAIDAAFVV